MARTGFRAFWWLSRLLGASPSLRRWGMGGLPPIIAIESSGCRYAVLAVRHRSRWFRCSRRPLHCEFERLLVCGGVYLYYDRYTPNGFQVPGSEIF